MSWRNLGNSRNSNIHLEECSYLDVEAIIKGYSSELSLGNSQANLPAFGLNLSVKR